MARAITTDTALRLSKALGVDARIWINIRTDYNEVERDLHSDDPAMVTTLVATEFVRPSAFADVGMEHPPPAGCPEAVMT